MAAHELKDLVLVSLTSNEKDEEYNIPLCLDDIISVCKEYNKLGSQMQSQVENILEIGVEESIKTGKVKRSSLTHIKNFLITICDNPYFGDAGWQAKECKFLIDDYIINNNIKSIYN